MNSENEKVYSVCRINLERFAEEDEEITTDEAVITEERIQHIQKNHPNDYEKYGKYIPDILENPDFVLKDDKPFTRIAIKAYVVGNEHFRLTVRLHTKADKPKYKNSVLTFQYIREKEFTRLSKNKILIYKRKLK